ncbi:MBL fold metallo-hydrolase [Rossellomorea aquimaris]|uniref:MBL fold metallo-hydrolase n=1 Tax=Rossellomorea TaxID=2837508 RepID=UPI0021CCCB1D|nr:MBL fold metallo-hydrolase [Rossellomorea vietnamensis]
MKKMPMTSVASGIGIEVLPDLYNYTVQIVNIAFVGNPRASNEFILIDAGMPDSHEMIIKAAQERFGDDCVCKAIILTHGHFDHVGALEGLLKKWDVPVYAHSMEKPYLSGESDYPPPNTEESGLVAKMSTTFPRHSIDISSNLNILPEDGTIPVLPDWRYIQTPGHTPGHISLFRDRDQALIAGDAFINVEQEKLCLSIKKGFPLQVHDSAGRALSLLGFACGVTFQWVRNLGLTCPASPAGGRTPSAPIRLRSGTGG